MRHKQSLFFVNAQNKGIVGIFVLVLVLVIAVAGGAYYFSTQRSASEKQEIIGRFGVPDLTSGWKRYEFKWAGLEFKLPPNFPTTLSDQQEVSGLTGFQATMRFGFSVDGGPYQGFLTLGGTTVDFSEERGNNFFDTLGFTKREGKYFFKTTRYINDLNVEVIEHEITPDTAWVTEIVNPNGMRILKIKGKPFTSPPESYKLPPVWQLSGDKIGALINANNSNYPGIGVVMTLDKDLITEADFDKILSTFKFTSK